MTRSEFIKPTQRRIVDSTKTWVERFDDAVFDAYAQLNAYGFVDIDAAVASALSDPNRYPITV